MPFQSQNNFGDLKPKVFLEPIKEWSFFKGDRVSIIKITLNHIIIEIQTMYVSFIG